MLGTNDAQHMLGQERLHLFVWCRRVALRGWTNVFVAPHHDIVSAVFKPPKNKHDSFCYSTLFFLVRLELPTTGHLDFYFTLACWQMYLSEPGHATHTHLHNRFVSWIQPAKKKNVASMLLALESWNQKPLPVE
jgi:hypothetical protein